MSHPESIKCNVLHITYQKLWFWGEIGLMFVAYGST